MKYIIDKRDILKTRFNWSVFDRLIKQNGFTIDRPKNTRHPRYKQRIYPFDYGYINNTIGSDGSEIDTFIGEKSLGLVGVVFTEDSIKKDKEIKLLLNMDYNQAITVEKFLNYKGLKGKLIWRKVKK